MTSANPFNDLFAKASGGSKFPKVEDLDGKLLLIVPSKIETVRNQFYKPGGSAPETVERASADVTVFEDDGERATFDDMFLSQVALVNACRGALKPGNKPMVLGRLRKYPTNDTKEAWKIATPEEFADAFKAWAIGGGKVDGKSMPQPRHVWVMDEFDDADAAKARAYIAERDAFAPAE